LKFIFLNIFIFTFTCGFAQNHWVNTPSPTSLTLTNCYFIDRNTGWAAGDSGVIIKTTNGGINWTIQNSGIFNSIEEIFFLNVNTGWATAWEIFPDTNTYSGTILLKTTNSGLNWTKSMFRDTNYYMTTIFFKDALNGYMGGTPATIVYTSDGGENWLHADIDTTLFILLPIFKIAFFNDQVGYACGGFRDLAGITWVTTNAGRNWDGEILAPEPFFDISILTQQKAICSGGDLEFGSSVARTTNQGVNWFYDTLGVFGLATGISARTQYEIWMSAGYAQKFLYSNDTGLTWTSFDTPDQEAVFDVFFPDSIYGFAVGSNGAILKYERPSGINSSYTEIYEPSKYKLYQNFPNPFNPETEINYEIMKTYNVILEVYNLLGEKISTIVSEKQKAGEYSYRFSGADIPSGVYCYTLILNDDNDIHKVTRRMLLLK